MYSSEIIYILAALLAYSPFADARAVAPPPSPPAAMQTSPPSPEKVEAVLDLLKRASVDPPGPGLYDSTYSAPNPLSTIVRPGVSGANKNAFLTWIDKTGGTNTFTNNVDAYPYLTYTVDIPPDSAASIGGSGPGGRLANFPDPALKFYNAPVDTGSSMIIFGVDKIGGMDNLDYIDPLNYNGYQLFPLENGGDLILGRWTKLQITLKGGADGQAVTATPTVLIATQWATNCAGFVAGSVWPTPGVLSTRNDGPTNCNAPGYDFTNSKSVKSWVGPWPANPPVFADYFGMGWGNFNQGKQIPINSQFARTITGLTAQGGTQYSITSGSTSSCGTNCNINQGYTIGRKGIQFGLINHDDCLYYSLAHSAFNSADWIRPSACIQFFDKDSDTVINSPGGNCQFGQILPDTGQPGLTMRIGQDSTGAFPANFLPASQMTTGGTLPANTHMKVWLGWVNAAQQGNWGAARSLAFDYKVGVTSPFPNGHGISPPSSPAPPSTDLMYGRWSTYGSFMNTGRRFFDLYDMCWSPLAGSVGFRPKQSSTWNGQTGGGCVYC